MNSQKEYTLALGGGAARGYAHIGVIQGIEEDGLRIQEISGTSMGAIIGAFYALGMTTSEMRSVLQENTVGKFIDPSFKKGLLRGNRIVSFLKKYFSEIQIEDLPIKLNIAATDMRSGNIFYFREGSLIDALRCSISIPGIFEPYSWNDTEYIDGGIIENLPIGAIELKHLPLIASSVQIPFYGSGVNGKYLSHTYNILRRTVAISLSFNESISREKFLGELIFLQNKNTSIDYLDFQAFDTMIESGYQTYCDIFHT